MKYNRKIWIVIIFAAALLQLDGQSNLLAMKGKSVAEGKRIPLSEGSTHQGSWKTTDLTINYEYLRNQNDLRISGEVIFRHETVLDRFNCSVSFIDAAGMILDTTRLAASAFRQEVSRLSFNKNLKLPQGTRSIAYSYVGRWLGAGDKGCSPHSFWSVPW